MIQIFKRNILKINNNFKNITKRKKLQTLTCAFLYIFIISTSMFPNSSNYARLSNYSYTIPEISKTDNSVNLKDDNSSNKKQTEYSFKILEIFKKIF